MKRDPDVKEVLDRLSAPFDPAEVKHKPQMVKGNRALAMAYVDARLIQDRLDEVLGGENWSDRYTPLGNGSVLCELSLRLGGEWVAKSDVGGMSEQPDAGDRDKSAVSDALKRAAVKWGIGRYLYRLPAQWCDYDPVKKQFAGLPQLPAFAVPADCKPCGPEVAGKVASLIHIVCQRTGKDEKVVTDALLEEFRVPAGGSLARLRHKDAVSILQRLNAKVAELAKGPGSGVRAAAPAGAK